MPKTTLCLILLLTLLAERAQAFIAAGPRSVPCGQSSGSSSSVTSYGGIFIRTTDTCLSQQGDNYNSCGTSCMALANRLCASIGEPRRPGTVSVVLTSPEECEDAEDSGVCINPADSFMNGIELLTAQVPGGQMENVASVKEIHKLPNMGLISFEVTLDGDKLVLIVDGSDLYIYGIGYEADDGTGLVVRILEDDAKTHYGMADTTVAANMLGRPVSKAEVFKLPLAYGALDWTWEDRATMTFQPDELRFATDKLLEFVRTASVTQGPDTAVKNSLARFIVAISEATRFSEVKAAVRASLNEVGDSNTWSMGLDAAALTQKWLDASNWLRNSEVDDGCIIKFKGREFDRELLTYFIDVAARDREYDAATYGTR